MQSSLIEDYETRRGAHLEAAGRLARTQRGIGVARLASFAVIALGAAAVLNRPMQALGWTLLGFGSGALIGLVAWHARIRERLRLRRSLAAACALGVARALRRWDVLPPAMSLEHDAAHAFADDLHLTGPLSLARLLPVVTPVAGRAVLAEWLLAERPPAADVIRARQTAVRELAPQSDWRERLSSHAGRVTSDGASLDRFVAWAEAESPPRPVRRWIARGLAALAVALLVAALVGAVPAAMVLIVLVVNIVVATSMRKRLAETLDPATGHSSRLEGYRHLLVHAQSLDPVAPALRALAARLDSPRSTAALATLDRLARSGEMRFSPMAHFIAQALVLWDLHVVDALDAWRRRHGREVRDWIGALAELEGLSALATLAHDNPGWSVPEILDPPARSLEARDIAHPLLAADVRVANDVDIAPPRPILLVTGSNMAGKTTLLRAIGLNVVLANAGGLVCAASLRLPPLRVRTSIGANDALGQGLSLFMAELLRVRAIVDAARDDADAPLLYLADEVLRGTNADDRHVAIVRILSQLVRTRALGVVATHDTRVASDPALEPYLRQVHLIEQFHGDGAGGEMWFDYRLRPGLATTSNAIRLLDLVGLGDDSPSGGINSL